MKRCMVLLMALSAACAAAQAQTPPAPSAEAALHAATGRAGDSHALVLTGDLAAHDPTLVRSRRGDWFVFSTGAPELAGGTVQIRRSADGREWFHAGHVFERIPDWLAQAVPGVQNLWAPHVHYHAGTYYLYYSASTFGSNRSVIALATNTTLDPQDPAYRWVDQGLVYATTPQSDHNAIDPVVAEDEQGTPWMAFGSFWTGIRMLRLEWPSGKPVAGQEPLRLGDRFVPPNAIEAPALVRHGGWYYLFVSFDFCCRGTGSTYKVAVARSRSLTGPYLDRLGTPLQHGGGTVILSERGAMFGPGGQDIYSDRHGDYLVHHWYDAQANGAHRLGIRRIEWKEGWPEVADAD